MNLRRMLLDLQAERTAHLTDAEAAIAGNDQAAYDVAMTDVSSLDTRIANISRLIEAQGDPAPTAPQTPAQGEPDDADGETVRASNEYARAFCQAVRMGFTPRTARGEETLAPLLDVLTEGTDANGGFLVPVDLQTAINEYRRQLVALADLVTVENVTTNTGYRVFDTQPTAGFTKITDETTAVPTDSQPAFSRVGYTVDDYGLIVPISNDLLEDNDAGLLDYLARWMAKKAVLTENSLILTKLAALTATTVAAAGEVAAIKTALNVSLDPDIALGAVLLTNQAGYDGLDQLKDTTGRGLIQPDITAGSGYQIKGKHITVVSNAMLANKTAGSPLYIGDLTQYLTLFRRKTMEFATTNIGGDAWRKNQTEGRAIMRMGIQVIDSSAAVSRSLAGGLAAG